MLARLPAGRRLRFGRKAGLATTAVVLVAGGAAVISTAAGAVSTGKNQGQAHQVLTSPQPASNADFTGNGANVHGPYDSTRDGSPSGNGNGNGNATGKPCAGCVGKADNKNPRGQMPGGSDANAGYECDRNHGVGRSNPAHTSCVGTTTTGTTTTGTTTTGTTTGGTTTGGTTTGETTTGTTTGETTTGTTTGETTSGTTTGGTTTGETATGTTTGETAGTTGETAGTTGETATAGQVGPGAGAVESAGQVRPPEVVAAESTERSLASTGVPVLGMVAIALMALIPGIGLAYLARRRRASSTT